MLCPPAPAETHAPSGSRRGIGTVPSLLCTARPAPAQCTGGKCTRGQSWLGGGTVELESAGQRKRWPRRQIQDRQVEDQRPRPRQNGKISAPTPARIFAA